MTPAGFTIILVTYSGADSIGHGARAPIFTNSWERGGHQTPYLGFLCPWTKLREFRLSDNLTTLYHRGGVPQTVGPEPQGTGACPHFYK